MKIRVKTEPKVSQKWTRSYTDKMDVRHVRLESRREIMSAFSLPEDRDEAAVETGNIKLRG